MHRIIQKTKDARTILPFLLLGTVAPLGYAQSVFAAAGDCSNLNSCNLISNYINPFINFLSALVGVGVVVSIVIGGIQYSSSAGDPGKASAAKNRIRNAIIALIAFLLLYGMLNFLVPGGLV